MPPIHPHLHYQKKTQQWHRSKSSTAPSPLHSNPMISPTVVRAQYVSLPRPVLHSPPLIFHVALDVPAHLAVLQIWRANMLQILETLPASLLPSNLSLHTPGAHYQPPRFNFGFILSRDELLAIAEAKGFLPSPSSVGRDALDTIAMSVLLIRILASSGYNLSSYVRIDALSTPPEGYPSHVSGSEDSLTTSPPVSPPPLSPSTSASTSSSTSTTSASPATQFYSITLTDSHRSSSGSMPTSKLPPPNDIDTVRAFLSLPNGRKARWYLDRKWSSWQYMRAEEILVEEKPFAKAFATAQASAA